MIVRGARLPLGGWALAVALAVGPAAGCLPGVARPEPWVEVRTPRVAVVSDAGGPQAREVAAQFERMREVLRTLLPRVRVDSGRPLVVLAVRDGEGLRALLPAYWERPGGQRPAGVFLPGPDRNYVALRLDAEGGEPYRVVYHEYVHLLVRLNFEGFPLWLDEGLAEFYGSVVVGEEEADVGRPVAAHLERLRSRPLIPLEAFLTAGRSSAWYTDASRAPSFYAQSWLLTHYLILGGSGEQRDRLAEYLRSFDEGVDGAEAARRAFGALGDLAAALERYRSLPAYRHLPVRAPFGAGFEGAVRELTRAEHLTARGEFHSCAGRTVEARRFLEEALLADPYLADTHEALGYLALREGRVSAARLAFDQALALRPGSFRARYYRGTLALGGTGGAAALAGAETDLAAAVDLNPEFAPALVALALVRAARGDRGGEAVALARRAVDLEPGVTRHRIALAQVLLGAGEARGAAGAARSALRTAGTPEERAAAESILAEAERRGASGPGREPAPAR